MIHAPIAPSTSDELRQQRYFERARNQYPRSSLADPPLHTAIEIRRIIEAVGPPRPDRLLVDFGCGTGRISLALARARHSVIAVDLSPTSLSLLREVAAGLGNLPVETRTELPSGPVAAVVGADVLHHVDMRVYLPRIHGLLEPGGKAVFSEPGALNPAWYVYLPFAHDIRIEARLVTCNLRTLRRAFRQAGFRDVTITGVGVLPRPLFGWSRRGCRVHDAAGNLPVLRWFAYRYLIVATKALSPDRRLATPMHP